MNNRDVPTDPDKQASGQMKAAFLGHQSWLLTTETTGILLDPILADGFGSDDQIEIYPPRRIRVKDLPRIQAVILSHEHSDHFHLPSLNLLSRDIEVLVGVNMPRFVQQTIEFLGFKVRRICSGQKFQVGDLALTLFGVSPQTAFWESRVNQLLIHSLKNSSESLFIAVDALISMDFVNGIRNGEIDPPSVVVLSNNAQITPPGVFGSLDNLTDPDGEKAKTGLHGLKILASLLNGYLQGIPAPREVIICGGGFMKGYHELGPFPFSDQKELAAIATGLAINFPVHGPYPGDAYELAPGSLVESRAHYVELDHDRFSQLSSQSASFVAARRTIPPRACCAPSIDRDNSRQLIERLLEDMVLPMMLSPFGENMIDLREYLTGALGPKRLVVLCLDEQGQPCRQWALDVARAAFLQEEPLPTEELTILYPYGMVLFESDLQALAEGQVQIWDLAGVSMRAWYVGQAETSPVAFLYTWLGEHASPRFYRDNYGHRVAQLGVSASGQ